MVPLLARALACQIQASFETLGESARHAFAIDPPAPTGSTRLQWTREENWAIIRSLCMKHFQVIEFTEDSSFVNDRGAD